MTTARFDSRPRRMGFGEAIQTCFEKYATFDGRARRSEFWFFTLFRWLVAFFAVFADAAANITLFAILSWLLLTLPWLAVGAPRLHDTDRSGWWLLIVFVPLLGIVALIIFLCEAGEGGTNRFGPDPAADDSDPRSLSRELTDADKEELTSS